MTRKSFRILSSDIHIIHGLPSDHHAVQCTLDSSCPPPIRRKVIFRKINSIDIEEFTRDIQQSSLFTNKSSDVCALTNQYNELLSDLLDKHAPVRTKTVTQTKPEWYNSNNLHDMKRQRRRLERRFLQSGLHVDKKRYNDFCIIFIMVLWIQQNATILATG